jgi:hypothetical protein
MAEKLVNMKIDPKAREARYKETAIVEGPIYPYGLSVHLDDEVMAKLGLKTLPEVGKPLMLLAKVNVTSVSENQTSDGGKAETRQSVSLQITDLCLEAVGDGDASTALYGE